MLFRQDTIEYLRFVISHGHLQMDLEKVLGILKWPQPHNVKKVQFFLGFCNFYRQFNKDYSAIARPLFELTRKDTSFTWETPQQTAYDTLLHAFTTAPVLTFPDPEKPYRLITDASDFTVGAILEQPDVLNRWHLIIYYSKSLQPAERNYEIHDKELLAIILALEHFSSNSFLSPTLAWCTGPRRIVQKTVANCQLEIIAEFLGCRIGTAINASMEWKIRGRIVSAVQDTRVRDGQIYVWE